MNKIFLTRASHWKIGALLFGLGGALVFATHSGVQAAPAKPAGPVLDANDQAVIKQLTFYLKKRIKSGGGKPVSLKIVPTARASEGYFSEITMSGSPAKLKKLYVSQFNMRARNVQIDVPALMNTRKIRTKKSSTQLRAVISEGDLTKMLGEGRRTKSMNLKVKYLPNGSMRVSGNLDFTLLNGPVTGIGRLRQTSDRKLFLDVSSLKLRGAEVPGPMKNYLSNQINPVIDYDDLPFNPPFKSVKVIGNKAVLSTS